MNFKKNILLFVVIFLILMSCISCRSKNKGNKPNKENPNKPQDNRNPSSGSLQCDFSTNVLALTWPQQFCNDEKNKSRCIDNQLKYWNNRSFTIHGLWPGTSPYNPKCNINKCLEQYKTQQLDKFNKDHLDQTLIEEMEKIWKSIALKQSKKSKKTKGIFNLWEHQWNDHGRCYAAIQSDLPKSRGEPEKLKQEALASYFQSAVQLYKSHKEFQNLPAGQFESKALLAKTLKLKESDFIVKCQREFVSQLKVCYSKDIHEMIPCQIGEYDHQCKFPIKFYQYAKVSQSPKNKDDSQTNASDQTLKSSKKNSKTSSKSKKKSSQKPQEVEVKNQKIKTKRNQDECQNTVNVLSLPWLDGFCKDTENLPCYNKLLENWDHKSFVIHGLWPGTQPYNDACGKQCTDKNEFVKQCSNVDYLQKQGDLISKMLEYWPYKGQLRDSNPSLWDHEWQKHGTCYSGIQLNLTNDASDDPTTSIGYDKTYQKNYFNQAVQLYESLNVRKLTKNTFTKQQFAQHLNLKVNQFYFWCEKFIVTELRICYSVTLTGTLHPQECNSQVLKQTSSICNNGNLVLTGFDSNNLQKQVLNPSAFAQWISVQSTQKDAQENKQEPAAPQGNQNAIESNEEAKVVPEANPSENDETNSSDNAEANPSEDAEAQPSETSENIVEN